MEWFNWINVCYVIEAEVFLTCENIVCWTYLLCCGLPHPNVSCRQLTQLTGGKKFTYAYEGSRLPHVQVCFIEIHQVFAKTK
jgi:hypothetical protein